MQEQIEINGSFELGWHDLPPAPGNLINQEPSRWSLQITPMGEKLFDSGDVSNGIPECIHKIDTQLPPNEQMGQPEALILDGKHVYKVFHAGASFGVSLLQVVSGLKPYSECLFKLPIQVHRHRNNDDPYATEMRLILNDKIGRWWTGEDMPHKKWAHREMKGTVNGNGVLAIEIQLKSKWDLPVDFFLDNLRLLAERDDGTPVEPPPPEPPIEPPTPPTPPTDIESRLATVEESLAWAHLRINDLEERVDALEDPIPPDLYIESVVHKLTVHPTKEYNTRSESTITTITIHHTVSENPDPEVYARFHVNERGWPGIGYHYLIRQDGHIFQTNSLNVISYHDTQNVDTLGVAMIGDFTAKAPTTAQLRAAHELVKFIESSIAKDLKVVPHRHIETAETVCPGDTWNEWFDQIESGYDVTPPPNVPQTVDILQYFLPHDERNSMLYEVKTEGGGQERHQTQPGSGKTFYHTKNNHWEGLMYDDQFIYRTHDTSHSDTTYYTLSDGPNEPSKWAWRHMPIGVAFKRMPNVAVYEKDGCKEISYDANVVSYIRLMIEPTGMEFFTGVKLENVIWMEASWDEAGARVFEKYFYAAGFGLVAWESWDAEAGHIIARSAISEIHGMGQRPDNEREIIPCISL